MSKIAYAVVTLNRLSELQRAIRNVSSNVDCTFVSDGGSTDGTIEWLQSDECKKLNVQFQIEKQYRFQYGNHTPIARQPYLDMALKNNCDWIYVSDTDEYLEEHASRNIRGLVQYAESNGYDGIAFRAHDIWTYEDGQVYDNVSNYWNATMFRTAPGMHYGGHTHSGIVRPGARNKFWQAPYEYLHIKHERQMWKGSTFLYWTTAKNADNVTNDTEWLEFHELMKQFGYLDWHEFSKVMDAGTVPEPIVKWFIDHKDHDNPEVRAWFVHYLIFLHPTLNKDQVSNKDKQWDYVQQCQLKK